MTTRTTHATVTVRRSLDAPVPRVFRAWSDRAAVARWYLPGNDWVSRVDEHDFRVGGRVRMTFGPRSEPPYFECSHFEDIVPQARIVYAMTVGRGELRLTTSMVTVCFTGTSAGTDLVVTDQMVILDDRETSADREAGWGETLDKLAPELAR